MCAKVIALCVALTALHDIGGPRTSKADQKCGVVQMDPSCCAAAQSAAKKLKAAQLHKASTHLASVLLHLDCAVSGACISGHVCYGELLNRLARFLAKLCRSACEALEATVKGPDQHERTANGATDASAAARDPNGSDAKRAEMMTLWDQVCLPSPCHWLLAYVPTSSALKLSAQHTVRACRFM